MDVREGGRDGVGVEGETYHDSARDMLQGVEQEEGISCLLGGSFVGHGGWLEGNGAEKSLKWKGKLIGKIESENERGRDRSKVREKRVDEW